MGVLFSDTDPETERVLLDLMRSASVERKLAMLGEMNESARQLALMGLHARHPDATEPQIRRYLADLLLGPELAEQAYGPHQAEIADAC
jgi:hypothetical protein